MKKTHHQNAEETAKRQQVFLSLEQVKRLRQVLCTPEHRLCAAGVGLQLWAGVRPAELERLRWRDVDLEALVVHIPGGAGAKAEARAVQMPPILKDWLRKNHPIRLPRSFILPPGWARRWKAVRTEAGLEPWSAGALLRTFAQYEKPQGAIPAEELARFWGDA